MLSNWVDSLKINFSTRLPGSDEWIQESHKFPDFGEKGFINNEKLSEYRDFFSKIFNFTPTELFKTFKIRLNCNDCEQDKLVIATIAFDF